jgi:hypothetical protein
MTGEAEWRRSAKEGRVATAVLSTGLHKRHEQNETWNVYFAPGH